MRIDTSGRAMARLEAGNRNPERATFMNVDLPQYLTGEKVHAGDRVRYKGEVATVAFVSDGEQGEFSSGYEDYYGQEAGIMLHSDEGELTFLAEPGDDLELMHPASPAGQ
jgi:hypothetical protein